MTKTYWNENLTNECFDKSFVGDVYTEQMRKTITVIFELTRKTQKVKMNEFHNNIICSIC